jgi:DNA primase
MTVNATSERQRYSIRAAAAKLKEAISLERYLAARGVEVSRHGRARCLAHGGSNPTSFSIDSEQQLWNCFSCGHGGDLIVLCELVEKHADTFTAVLSLAQQFNVELPQRPPRWHHWQDQKSKVRAAVIKTVARRYQERLLRLYAPLVLLGGESTEEELAALEELGTALWPYCQNLARKRIEDAA